VDDQASIQTAKRYLRRKYADNIPGLKQLAEDVVRNGAFDAVTITGNVYEGGSGQGQLTFSPIAYLEAIESLLAELDPENTPASPERSAAYLRFNLT